MKRLTLIRHGKSSWDDESIADMDRPLNERGLANAPEMGKRLALQGFQPELLLCSPARRTLDTAHLLARETGFPPDHIEVINRLYLASVAELLAIVRLLDDHVDDVWLVGHNPDLLDFANQLTDQPIEKLPTCGVFSAEFDTGTWRKLAMGTGRRVLYDTPKQHQPA